ncbi:L,D-transpeptidase family protein [Desulfobacter hydrogenophilus]|nr:L,D-transpeptidase family protein [Desulfobacter hydrogenophilus]
MCLWLSAAYSKAGERDLAKVMADHLQCYPLEILSFEEQNPIIIKKSVCLAAIYHKSGAEPLWVSEKGPGERAAIILKYLRNAGNEGLNPADYQVKKIERQWADLSLNSLAELDTLLTYNMVKYIHDVSYGQLKPYMVNPKLFAEAGERGFDPLKMVETIRKTEDLEAFFQSLPPQHRQYMGLKNALIQYSGMKYSGLWQKEILRKSIRPGDEDEKIIEIKKRIALLENAGVESLTTDNLSLFDDDLMKKMIRFQLNNGLEPDGIIGPKTMRELNKSPQERLDQIKVNMTRWRWHDHTLGDKYILVNIANYRLFAYETDKLKFSMPVIVGELQNQTPVFSDKIKYLELNPYWNMPPSIAKNEELPKLRKNPNYLVNKNIRLFSNWQKDGVEIDSTVIDWNAVTPSQMAGFKLRQDPGPANALGRVKFVFPNQYFVYLHDTPSKKLFSRQTRSFSHGCIRVSEPEKLAAFLLNEKDNKWDRERVNHLINLGKRKVLKIRPTIPIHITYQTAWVDKNGQINFNGDVYRRDEKLYQALFIK